MDRSRIVRALIGLLFCGAGCQAAAPAAVAAKGEEMTLAAFLAEVAASNLDYAAARYNVPLAEAQLMAARVSPNPAITAGTSGRDVSERGQNREPANNDFGVSQTIELAGKRGKRVAVAQANLAQAAATLEDFFRTLRGNAAVAFVDAVTKRRIVEEKRRSVAALDQLVAANRKRLEVGDIGEIDLVQSRVDALQFRGEYLAAQADAQAAVIGLDQLLGRREPHAAPAPAANLEAPPRSFDAETLFAAALQHRPDVSAARHALASARAGVEVARALRVPDVTAGLTYQANQRSHNDVAPAPSFASIAVSLSLPLPIFNRYRGELELAHATAAQAETTLRAAELRARSDVRQALARYELAQQRAAQYQGGALEDAAAVLKAKLFSYEHGAATLLDLLNAQRAENDVRLAYLAALDERAKALVAVEQAAGIWDVDLE